MAATVDFGNFQAIIRAGRWRLVSAKDRDVGKAMVAFLNDHVPDEAGDIPDRDSWAAQLAVRDLGGRITQADRSPVAREDEVQ